MTTTPAPLDLDEMAKLAAPITDGTTWKVEYHETQQVWVIRSGPECVAECFDKEEALALVGIRNNWPALLDELATERRQGAAMASITGEAIRQISEERDAAREELAKTRAELDEIKADAANRFVQGLVDETTLKSLEFRNNVATMDMGVAREIAAAFVAAARTMLGDAPNYTETKVALDVKVAESPELYTFVVQRHAPGALTPHEARQKAEADHAAALTELERLRGVIREGVDMAEWHRNEITNWKRKAAKLREQLGNAKARISAAATVEVWTNEDGKRFVFADDVMRALDPNPEASPATTAEPADEPKATCNGNCIHHHGEVVVEDLCCPLHGVDAEPAAS